MTRFATYLLPLVLVAAIFVPLGPSAFAQDQAEDAADAPKEDAGFLERQIQNALGGEGRDVRVVGLSGVLSSEASIELVQISDDDGIWLTAKNIVLDWRRLALLRGRLEVDALTIGSVDFVRPPLPAPGDAPAIAADPEAAGPFALPDLPVSVNVQTFGIESLKLGSALIGQDAEMTIDGSASLADGEGKVDLSLTRIDGTEGRFSLNAGFENETRRLFVDLDVAEDQGGIIAGMSGMPGTPPLTLTVKGDAPISDFEARIALATEGIDRLSGTFAIEEQGEGAAGSRLITADLSGDVANLFLPEYQNFFGRNVALAFRANQSPTDGLDISQLQLETNGMTLNGTVSLGPEYLPRNVDVTAHVGTESGLPVVLPISGPAVLLHNADLDIKYDESTGDAFALKLIAEGVQRTDGLLINRAEILADGSLTKSDPSTPESVSATVTSAVDGFSHTDEALWEAVGDDFDFRALVNWATGQDLEITELTATAGNLALSGDINVANLQASEPVLINANVNAEAGDLARFSAIAGQPVTGAIDTGLVAQYNVSTGGFDVQLDGQTEDLSVGVDSANDLLAGTLSLKLDAARTENGLDLRTLSIDGRAIELAGNASLGADGWPRKVDVAGRVGAPDGEPVALPLPGPETLLQSANLDLSYDAEAGDAFKALIEATGFAQPDMQVDDARISADGTITRGDGRIAALVGALTGDVNGFTHINPGIQEAAGRSFDLGADVAWNDGAPLEIRNLRAAAGDLTLTGDATVAGLQGEEVTVDAEIRAEAGDLARFSTISGQTLDGALGANLDAKYNATTSDFDVTLKGQSTDLQVGEATTNALLAGQIDLDLRATRDETGIDLSTLSLQGDTINLGGTAFIDPVGWPLRVDIAGLVGSNSGAPIVLPMSGPAATLQQARIDMKYDADQGDSFSALIDASGFSRDGVTVGTTRINADGTLRRAENEIARLTAKIVGQIADASAEDPAMNSTLSDGARVNADLDWDVSERLLKVQNLNVTSGPTRLSADAEVTNPGLAGMNVATSFNLDTGNLSRFAPLTGQALNGTLVAVGSADYAADTGFFNVDATADGQNLAIGIPQADQLIGGTSTIVAKARQDENGLQIETATLETPQINLAATGGTGEESTAVDIDGRLSNLGLLVPGINGPLILDATATNRNDIWSLVGTVDGPGGARVTANGQVLRPDGTMNVKLNGSLPLGLANVFLEPRSVQGNMVFDMALNGTPGLGALSGTATVNGARLADPATHIVVENIALNLGFADSRVNLNVDGNFATGGQIAIDGPITLTGDLPADLSLRMTNVNLVDPSLYDVNLDGEITMTGPLAGGATIAGRIDVDRSEIQIPSSFGGPSAIPDIRHVGEPASSLLTRKRAGVVETPPPASGESGGPAYPLNIVISAPQEIFIRGRGLDAEMGGSVTIGGTTANPVTSGGLQLIRGRMDLLSQRLEFEEATISLQGDLVPDIRMVAVSNNGSIVAKIIIEGPINAPEITLTSEPELPEDEVLAQLFFGKPVSQLSPIELAQLASAINELTGGGGGLFGKIRDSLGVDDLNIQRDEEGNTSVTAGKYLTERVFTDVTVGSDGTSELNLNYEIRKGFTARTGFDSEGGTGVGLSYEIDY